MITHASIYLESILLQEVYAHLQKKIMLSKTPSPSAMYQLPCELFPLDKANLAWVRFHRPSTNGIPLQ